MFGRRKKVVAPPPKPEPLVIFGEVTVPGHLSGISYSFKHEGYQINGGDRSGKHTVSSACRQCGEFAHAEGVWRDWSWEEVKQLVLCADCKWLEGEYEGDLARPTDEIEDLEVKHENLLTSFTALPGVKRPESLSWDDLENAGLILNRKDQGSILGFILIDYSREEMHRLGKAVDGQLEPFSRGFKLFLGIQYYKLFPGSYWWRSRRYTYHMAKSYLDYLREEQRKIEAKADRIRSRIKAHAVA